MEQDRFLANGSRKCGCEAAKRDRKKKYSGLGEVCEQNFRRSYIRPHTRSDSSEATAES